MKEFENGITAKSRKSALKTAIPCLAASVCFFALAVWMFVTGCSNILQINDLNKNGVAVQITVTNVRIDSSRENTAYYYTFSYNVDSKTYEFVDSSDRDYEVGDTFTARIDPDHPQTLVLPNNNLFFAFLMLLFSACAPKRYDKSNIHELYDADWIIGKTAEQIQDKYGRFDDEYTSPTRGCYDVNEHIYDSFLDPNNIHDTYVIEFNEDGIAVNAFFAETSRGG